MENISKFGDRPTALEDGIELTLTPAMVDAGAEAVFSLVGDVIPRIGGEAHDLARAVYLAMRRALSSEHIRSSECKS